MSLTKTVTMPPLNMWASPLCVLLCHRVSGCFKDHFEMKRAALVGIPPLTLDRRRPLSRQISAGIRAAIQTGRIRVGDRLPASRTLARAIGVARQVVVAAYEDLAASGHLAG